MTEPAENPDEGTAAPSTPVEADPPEAPPADRPPRPERRPSRDADDDRIDPESGNAYRPYPVVAEQGLDAAQHRLFRGDRRSVAELPSRPTGCVYVFEYADGRYRRNSAPGHLTGTEQEFVEACSVSVVEVRPRDVTATVRVPSVGSGTDFVISVTYTCEVEDAAAVAAHNLVDLRGRLRAHLRKDPNMLEFHHQFYEDQIDVVRGEVLAYLLATHRSRPPRIDGMTIELQDVEVRTPRAARRQAVRMRDLRWDEQADRVTRAARRRRVEDIDDLTSTAGGAAAFAVDNGDMSAARVAEHRMTQEEKRADELREQLGKAIDSGALNRRGGVQLDIMEAAVADLTGRPPRDRGDAPREITDRTRERGKRRDEEETDEPPFWVADGEDDD